MRKRSVVPGLVLIAVGVVVLLSNVGVPWLNMEQLWPVVLMLLGLLALISVVTGRAKDKAGIWFGVVGLLAGAVFLYITVGAGEWEDIKTLWPIFPAIAGLAWIVQWVFERHAIADLALGVGALAVAVVGYLVIAGRMASDQAMRLADFWPLLLVLVGVGLIAQHYTQRNKE
ncbi:MAG: hypothetical protein GX557_06735 [Chloroflexi bacterium]|nr:hypothetical protein [Chloroflexota bacterium]